VFSIGPTFTGQVNVSNVFASAGFYTMPTNTLSFTTVSTFTNTLGRDAKVMFTAGTPGILTDTNGNTVVNIPATATFIMMNPNQRMTSGTAVSATLY